MHPFHVVLRGAAAKLPPSNKGAGSDWPALHLPYPGLLRPECGKPLIIAAITA
jgi:hypothetical protein